MTMLAFYQAIQSIHTPIIDNLFILLSFLGSEPAYILLLSVIYWNIDKRFGFRLAVLFLTSMGLNGFLKLLFHTPRPIGQPGIRSLYLSSAAGSSFPSGHSQGAATFYPYLWQRWRSNKVWLILGVIMICGIGFSRLYLGVHWPGDVLGGFIIGGLLVLGFQRVDERLLKLQIPLRFKLALSVVLPLLFLTLYHTPQGIEMVGFVLGFSSGYFLEDHFLDYRERTKLLPSLLKTSAGLIVLGFWVWLWRPVTHQVIWLWLPVLTIGGVWASFGAPFLFRICKWEGHLEKETSPLRSTRRAD